MMTSAASFSHASSSGVQPTRTADDPLYAKLKTLHTEHPRLFHRLHSMACYPSDLSLSGNDAKKLKKAGIALNDQGRISDAAAKILQTRWKYQPKPAASVPEGWEWVDRDQH